MAFLLIVAIALLALIVASMQIVMVIIGVFGSKTQNTQQRSGKYLTDLTGVVH